MVSASNCGITSIILEKGAPGSYTVITVLDKLLSVRDPRTRKKRHDEKAEIPERISRTAFTVVAKSVQLKSLECYMSISNKDVSAVGHVQLTHRPRSSSFLGLPYRTLNMNPNKELLWGLWVKQWK